MTEIEFAEAIKGWEFGKLIAELNRLKLELGNEQALAMRYIIEKEIVERALAGKVK